jgi:hypothetical protein
MLKYLALSRRRKYDASACIVAALTAFETVAPVSDHQGATITAKRSISQGVERAQSCCGGYRLLDSIRARVWCGGLCLRTEEIELRSRKVTQFEVAADVVHD